MTMQAPPLGYPVNIGKRDRLASNPDGGGNFVVLPQTQLIAARFKVPRQWVVTLMQPVIGLSGVSPWVSTFDGSSTYPAVAPALMTAPELPVASPMEVHLRWGAGGVIFETKFDYPAAGGTFGVTADTLNLDVSFRGVLPTYNALDLVPVVGAFMVPGIAADSTPCRWRELGDAGTGYTAIAAGEDAFWAVKPYARRLRLASSDIATRYLVEWLDTAGASLWTERVNLAAVGDARIVDVPAQATVVRVVSNSAAPSTWSLEWAIGLV